MPLIADILRHRSLAVIGMAKNVGKTVTLSSIIGHMPADRTLAVTSIGVDGEATDSVTALPKPRIRLRAGTLFSTSEYDYNRREIVSQVIDISDERTPLGRIVTARALSAGGVVLSGSSSSEGVGSWMTMVDTLGADVILIDGALSRHFAGSLCRATILATGAALTCNVAELVRRTAFAIEMIRLPASNNFLPSDFAALTDGAWIVKTDADAEPLCDEGRSPCGGNFERSRLQGAKHIFVSGAVTDTLLDALSAARFEGELIVRDYSRLFSSQRSYRAFCQSGGEIRVLHATDLLAVTINPVAPNGMRLDSKSLCAQIEERTEMACYDVIKDDERDIF